MSAWREDGVFFDPGDIPESGTFRGESAAEEWFRRYFEQYPGIHFDVQSICVANIFDLFGKSETAVHWNLHLTNQEGREGENSGVTVVSIKAGKAVRVREFTFDRGEDLRRNWSAE
jgi:ketosteroid isomerase-like protein